MKIKIEEMKPKELEKIVNQTPIAYVPLGLIEWHSHHLPVGLDGIKIYELCLRMAAKSGGVVFPCTYWSVGGEPPMPHPWTAPTKEHIVTNLLLSIFEQINQMGFKVIMALTGHFSCEQMRVVLDTAEKFSAQSEALVVGVPEFALTINDGYCGDHAAKFETSLLIALRPDLVEIEGLGDELIDDFSFPQTFEKLGILGLDPRKESSRELGEKYVEMITSRFAELAKKLLNSEDKELIKTVHKPIREFADNPDYFVESILRSSP